MSICQNTKKRKVQNCLRSSSRTDTLTRVLDAAGLPARENNASNPKFFVGNPVPGEFNRRLGGSAPLGNAEVSIFLNQRRCTHYAVTYIIAALGTHWKGAATQHRHFVIEPMAVMHDLIYP
jgi:hypothetical protein